VMTALRCVLFPLPQQKKERVDRVINSLALQSCRNTHIGSVLARGISGGEVRSLRPLSFTYVVTHLLCSRLLSCMLAGVEQHVALTRSVPAVVSLRRVCLFAA